MKKVIFPTIILLLVFASTISAQKGLELGIEFTPASVWILNDEDFAEGDNLDFRGTFGYNGGINLGYNFSDGIGFTSGILISRQGQNYITGYDGVEKADQDYFSRDLNYIRIPFLIKFNGDPSASSSSYFRFGPHIDILSSARYVYEANTILGQIDADVDMTDYGNLEVYKSTVIGATLEFGGSANINEYMKLTFMLHLSGSLTNTEGEDSGATLLYPATTSFNRSNAWNVMAGINVGYRYIFSFN